jgi:Domain of unkown function (DUF1775)
VGDRTAEIHWIGQGIPPDGYAEFRFLARNPVRSGEIRWPVVQTYANGEVERWIGPPGSETPASRTRLADDVVPQDVVAVDGEPTATGAASGPARAAPVPAGGQDDGGGRDPLTRVLALVALALGAAALLTAVDARRRRAGGPR